MNTFTLPRMSSLLLHVCLLWPMADVALSQPMRVESMERHMEDMGRWHDHMLSHWDYRQNQLKAKLHLTTAQEASWKAFADAMKTALPKFAETLDRTELSKMTTPERIDAMAALREKHHADIEAHMKARSDAARAFYAQLTPEQQKIFDVETLPSKPFFRRN